MTLVNTDCDSLVIAICSTTPGNGKLTTAVNLAQGFARGKQGHLGEHLRKDSPSICFVEVGSNGLAGWTRQDTPNTSSLGADGVEITPESISEHLISSTGFHTLISEPGRDDLTVDFYWELLRVLRTMFDIIILDTPDKLSNPLFREVIYPGSDIVLFSVFPDWKMLNNFWVNMASLEGSGNGLDKSKVGVSLRISGRSEVVPTHVVAEYLREIPVVSYYVESPYNAESLFVDDPLFYPLGAYVEDKNTVLAVPAGRTEAGIPEFVMRDGWVSLPA